MDRPLNREQKDPPAHERGAKKRVNPSRRVQKGRTTHFVPKIQDTVKRQ